MKTILVIEDNKEVRENTAEMLMLHQYHVVTAQNGKTGFALAKKALPDLVLCDMMMPETDGRHFLNLAKTDEAIRNMPVIFFSAGTAVPDVFKTLLAGSKGYIKKPFLEKELLFTIEQVLAE